MDAPDVFADDVEVGRECRVAFACELVAAAALPGEDGHPVARFEPRDAVTHLVDDTRGVTARNVWQVEVDARKPAAGPDVEVVQRGRLHVDDHLVAARFGVGELAILEYITVAVTVELNGLHRHHFPWLAYKRQPPGDSPARDGQQSCRSPAEFGRVSAIINLYAKYIGPPFCYSPHITKKRRYFVIMTLYRPKYGASCEKEERPTRISRRYRCNSRSLASPDAVVCYATPLSARGGAYLPLEPVPYATNDTHFEHTRRPLSGPSEPRRRGSSMRGCGDRPMNLSLVIVATMTGVATGVLFGLLDVPIPAPPNLAGVMGILGILVGYRLIEYFDVGVSLLSLLKV